MHSEHDFPFFYEKLEGAISTPSQRKNIYFVSHMPAEIDLKKNYQDAYLLQIIKDKPVLFYVNQYGVPERLVLKGNEQRLLYTLKNEEARAAHKNFYMIPDQVDLKNSTGICDEVRKLSNQTIRKTNSDIILHKGKLYIFDKINEKMEVLGQFSNESVVELTGRLLPNNENKESDKVQIHALSDKERQYLLGLCHHKNRLLVDDQFQHIPINKYFKKYSLDAVYSFVSPFYNESENKERQYYLYETEVNPALYPPNKGDLIAKKFETMKKATEKGTLEVIDETLSSTLLNAEWRRLLVESTARTALRTLKSQSTYVNLLATLLSAVNPHSNADPYVVQTKIQEKLKDQLARQYKASVVEPRCDRAYPLAEYITSQKMQTGGLEVKMRLAESPFDIMKVWIVSSMAPEEVMKNNGISPDSQTFVCATEEDAWLLAERMKVNNKECLRYLAAEPFDVAMVDDQNFVISTLSNFVLRPIEEILRNYVKDREVYVEEYNALSPLTASNPVPVEMNKENDILFEEYLHFKQVADIYQKFTDITNIIGASKNIFKDSESKKLNKKFQELSDLCKKYIEQHPYKNKDTDPVFNLMFRLEQVNLTIHNAVSKSKLGVQQTAVADAVANTHESKKTDENKIVKRPPA